MGHLLFIILHLAALIFGVAGLIVTIPLHLIYAAVKSSRPAAPRPYIPGPGDIAAGAVQQVHCPDCRELIRSDARKCKHCGTIIAPPITSPIPDVAEFDRQLKAEREEVASKFKRAFGVESAKPNRDGPQDHA